MENNIRKETEELERERLRLIKACRDHKEAWGARGRAEAFEVAVLPAIAAVEAAQAQGLTDLEDGLRAKVVDMIRDHMAAE